MNLLYVLDRKSGTFFVFILKAAYELEQQDIFPCIGGHLTSP
ncbi:MULTISPECIES: hypothetical protein [Olivibacter]|uniref:Uncharacterized protein n=1 Tax=Olivibacter oleidegradans TaxID=760123 RepID=A0ABV6HR23_9SPHI|nr:hypothetical protein [Olivibacter jilunii]